MYEGLPKEVRRQFEDMWKDGKCYSYEQHAAAKNPMRVFLRRQFDDGTEEEIELLSCFVFGVSELASCKNEEVTCARSGGVSLHFTRNLPEDSKEFRKLAAYGALEAMNHYLRENQRSLVIWTIENELIHRGIIKPW